MVSRQGDIELLPAPDDLPQQMALARIARRRIRVFWLTFLLCLAVGMAWNWLRPPLYEARAALLTVAPPEAGQEAIPEADQQHVAIQRQRLLGRPLLERLARRLAQENPELDPPDADGIRAMVEVDPLPETNLVELKARGGDPALLSLLVNAWLETYLAQRNEEIEQLNATTLDRLREQYQALGEKITAKRQALEAFRNQHRILSGERDENQTLSRLKGLNEALNEANQELVKAKARLDAIEGAIARGETVIPQQDQRAYAKLVERAQQLREQVAEMNRRYTRQYIERSADLKVIPEKLAKLEAQIRKMRQAGQSYLLSSARQDYVAAKEAAATLQRQLDDFKAEAAEFTARFAEYQAMQEDLAAMEQRYRELEDRLVKVEIENRAKYPQLQVVEWAYPPAEPVWPHYWRDAALVTAGALLVALLAVWLIDFLKPLPKGESGPGVGINIYSADAAALTREGRAQAALAQERSPALEHEPATALPENLPPTLAPGDLARLLEGSDPLARQLLALLLSGCTVEEILALDEAHIDPAQGLIRVPGEGGRQLPLGPRARPWFERDGKPWLAWKAFARFDAKELDDRLRLAALDAGLTHQEVSAEAVRNSYLEHLVRLGLRLGDLERIAGPMSAQTLLALGRHAIPGKGRPLEAIDPIHPLLA